MSPFYDILLSTKEISNIDKKMEENDYVELLKIKNRQLAIKSQSYDELVNNLLPKNIVFNTTPDEIKTDIKDDNHEKINKIIAQQAYLINKLDIIENTPTTIKLSISHYYNLFYGLLIPVNKSQSISKITLNIDNNPTSVITSCEDFYCMNDFAYCHFANLPIPISAFTDVEFTIDIETTDTNIEIYGLFRMIGVNSSYFNKHRFEIENSPNTSLYFRKTNISQVNRSNDYTQKYQKYLETTLENITS